MRYFWGALCIICSQISLIISLKVSTFDPIIFSIWTYSFLKNFSWSFHVSFTSDSKTFFLYHIFHAYFGLQFLLPFSILFSDSACHSSYAKHSQSTPFTIEQNTSSSWYGEQNAPHSKEIKPIGRPTNS